MNTKFITPNLLAIDASSSICSIAVQYTDLNNKTIITDNSIVDNKQQAVYLLPAIDQLLRQNNLKLENIDAFVLGNGPGRFTGLRIAASCIQGLAYCCDKKIILIDSFRLLAAHAIAENNINYNKIIWLCHKAYGSVYYQAKYTVSDLKNIDAQTITKQKSELDLELTNSLSDKSLEQYFFVGSGWLDFSELLINIPINTSPANAKYSFTYATSEYHSNNLVLPFDAVPMYGVNPY